MGDRFSGKASLILFSVAFLLIIVTTDTVGAATSVEFVGDSIPSYYSIATGGIFFHSDSLYLNGNLLVRGIDYDYNIRYSRFDLSSMVTGVNDTLLIRYFPFPSWLNTSYGRSLPHITPSNKSSQLRQRDRVKRNYNSQSSDIKLSGSKSFRFTTQTNGGSNFSQSLDLSLAGNLTSGVNVTGAVSDRGYDPVYGTANSQLRELDRVYLEVLSQRFSGRVGDLVLQDEFNRASQRDKHLTGAILSYHDCHRSVHLTAARPKGHFQTVKLSGIDQLQGPYQIDPSAISVVPGSEQVWLDGQLLERGSHKDYVINYPVGHITFNVNHPIDSRSRIEIDYEPKASDYRGEYFATGGGVAIGDSIFTLEMEWLREGDDKSQPLAGELSDSDRELLESIGDSVGSARVSGVCSDSAGNYILIQDSLPDSVFQYVEGDSGDYTITFSFEGVNHGDYKYSGNGVYYYAGHGNGDYMPIRTVPLPQRTEHYITKLGFHNNLIGAVTAEWRQSLFDKNLISTIDDDDNSGALYKASVKKTWGSPKNEQYLFYQTRIRETRYRLRRRLDKADYDREFFLPKDFVPSSDERSHLFEGRISPVSFLSFVPRFAFLDYHKKLTSRRVGGGLEIMSHHTISGHFGWHIIRVNDNRLTDERRGEADLFNGRIRWDAPAEWSLSTNYEYDSRSHNYTGETQGTRYHRLRVSLDRSTTEHLNVEQYVEDTLTNSWTDLLRRTRMTVKSHRRLGFFSYTTTLTYQWVNVSHFVDNNFLGRLNLEYHDNPGRFQVRTSYLYSEEARRARGISYLQVGQGEGRYVYEEGEYRPDPNGDYVKVEEILSSQAHVSRGEKTFHISRDWSVVLVRYDSRIKEELMESGKRYALWVVPFISDESQPYLYYSRHHNLDCRLFPIHNVYTITMSLNEDKEIRRIGDSPESRCDRQGALSFRQIAGTTHLKETVEMFSTQRDSYYSGAGNVDGYSVDLTIRKLIGSHELSIGSAFRKANSANDERSELYKLLAGCRLGIIDNGELRTSLELYRQILSGVSGWPSFILTDNRSGTKGVVWSVGVRYGGKSRLRVNLSISGRHSDTKTARIIGHGEVVAGF
ncbi:MAG: hypothetical protein U9N55_09700 [candidate division Zixibacteria bacterium]|nr:hypothetical protein [candidate division Zixibacteria bacterium]